MYPASVAPPGCFIEGEKQDRVWGEAPENSLGPHPLLWLLMQPTPLLQADRKINELLSSKSRVPQLENDVQTATERPTLGSPKISTNLTRHSSMNLSPGYRVLSDSKI